jgi:hypothetical protein
MTRKPIAKPAMRTVSLPQVAQPKPAPVVVPVVPVVAPPVLPDPVPVVAPIPVVATIPVVAPVVVPVVTPAPRVVPAPVPKSSGAAASVPAPKPAPAPAPKPMPKAAPKTQDALTDEVYGKLKGCVPKMSMGDLVGVSIRAMALAQKYRLKGVDKKRLVIAVMGRLVADDGAVECAANAKMFVASQLPLIIDNMVMAANNPASIGKTNPGCC